MIGLGSDEKRAGGNKGAIVQMSAKYIQSPNPTSQVIGFQSCSRKMLQKSYDLLVQGIIHTFTWCISTKGIYQESSELYKYTEKYAAKKTTHEKKQASYSPW